RGRAFPPASPHAGCCARLMAPAILAEDSQPCAALTGSGLRLCPCGLQQALMPEVLPGLILCQVGLELAVVTQDNAALAPSYLKERQTHARQLALVSTAPALVNDLRLRHSKEVVLAHWPEHVLL